MRSLLLLLPLLLPSSGLAPALPRRAFLALPALSLSALAPPSDAAVKFCPPKAANCVIGVFAAPDASKAAAQLDAVLRSYPQEGHKESGGLVDGGGNEVLSSEGGRTVMEFRSAGTGNFAKWMNGGKPFVDDLEAGVEGGVAKVYSRSRVGDSDFGVNAARVKWIGDRLEKEGWARK